MERVKGIEPPYQAFLEPIRTAASFWGLKLADGAKIPFHILRKHIPREKS
jgi:hypothetical protein